MFIVRVARSFPPAVGGLENHAFELSRHHALAGHRTLVLTATRGRPVHALVRVERLPAPAPGSLRSTTLEAALFSAAAAGRLLRDVGLEPDIVHAHGDVAEAVLGGLIARRLRVPFVLTLHAGLSRSPLSGLAQRVGFRFPDLLLAVSEEIRREVLALGVPERRVVTRSSGVETGRFAQVEPDLADRLWREVGRDPGRSLVVAVGRLHAMKGYQHLIAAARILSDEGNQLRVVLVGDGPQGTSLRRQAEGLTNVLFLGERSREEVATLLQMADIFVQPSVDLPGQREGTPTAVIEAMAAGLPVVGTPIGGTPDLVGHGGGIVVPAGAPRALADAMRALCSDPERRRAAGARNRKVAVDYDWAAVAHEVLAAYSRVISARS